MTGAANEESDVIKTLRQHNKSLQEKAKQVGCSQVLIYDVIVDLVDNVVVFKF